MKTIRGIVPAELDVREALFVSGELRSGAIVRRENRLYVNGAAVGTTRVETGGELLVHGWLSGFIDENDGTILVSGEIGTPVELIPGRLAVMAGSTVTVNGRRQEVSDEGDLIAARPVGPLRRRSAVVLVRNERQRFIPSGPWASARELARLVSLEAT